MSIRQNYNFQVNLALILVCFFFQVCFLLFLAQNKNIQDKKFRGTQVTKGVHEDLKVVLKNQADAKRKQKISGAE